MKLTAHGLNINVEKTSISSGKRKIPLLILTPKERKSSSICISNIPLKITLLFKMLLLSAGCCQSESNVICGL